MAPLRGMIRTSCSCSSRRSASRMGVRLTFSCSAMPSSVKESPGANSKLKIRDLRIAKTESEQEPAGGSTREERDLRGAMDRSACLMYTQRIRLGWQTSRCHGENERKVLLSSAIGHGPIRGPPKAAGA